MYYAGIDCGTQGTKVLIYDPARKVFVGEGYHGHELAANERGGREQDPAWWIAALDAALRQALAPLRPDERRKVAGMGVSGQQHGLVILDQHKQVLRRAKLWNDTETADAARRYIEAAGGPDAVLAAIGTAVPVGYTASKVLWLRDTERDLFDHMAFALNPKDYINFYLTGTIATDAGSASGTGYFDVIHRVWSERMVSLIGDDFKRCLPPVLGDLEAAGSLRGEVAERFGLSESCLVAAGSGDNMMAAVGAGSVQNGIATVTLGTSGVLSVFTDTPPVGCPGIVQIQNSMPSGWLPTVCSMNATAVTTALQSLFGMDLRRVDAAMAAAPPCAQGVTMFPFFNGERAPALESERGAVTGLAIQNMSPENLIRAGAEAVAYGLRWGRDLLAERGAAFHSLRLVGGGSNSAPWRQIIADVFAAEVTGLRGREAGAFGGVLQAMALCGEGDLPTLCGEHVQCDDTKRALPQASAVSAYEEGYTRYLQLRKKLYGV
ncbi:MAG: xylulokinase [Treponema sp.]|jgi:xylulokinase|nr:xylulokinase [Treponema sp.]